MAAKQHFNNFMIVVSGSRRERSREGERERERGRGIERKIEGFGREENKEWGWSV